MNNINELIDLIGSPIAVLGLIALMVWGLIWKGIGMWHAARNGEKPWFILFLIVNTAGILEIIYLLILKSKGELK